MPTQSQPENDLVRYASRAGIELISGAAALAAGGVSGLIIGSAIASLRLDFSQRHLSDIENDRVNKLIIFGVNKFQSNLAAGKNPSEQGFDEATIKEIVEGFMTAAQHENQNRKIKYLGNLLGNLHFHPEVNQMYANLLLRTSESLTYNQLVLLQIFSSTETKALLLQEDYRNKPEIPWDVSAYLHEIKELFNLGLVGMPGDTMLGLTDVNPRKMNTQGEGKLIKVLMELNDLPAADIQQAVSVLSRRIN